jgi:hypothetical protein
MEQHEKDPNTPPKDPLPVPAGDLGHLPPDPPVPAPAPGGDGDAVPPDAVYA